MADDESNKIWVAHPSIDGEWVPGVVTARHDDGTVTIKSEAGHELTQKAEVRACALRARIARSSGTSFAHADCARCFGTAGAAALQRAAAGGR